ncbi:HNH endonuclease [Crenobacter cavernae]|uniref:HNH endonuclease n=1 Tax=Crenobacter cavernae TaxID=2290923 RepID=A0ABY0FFF1_9NEIS|nr:HNH endonuclease [Crenobacter cavernae]RXZ43806.1 HNH endonuclease [Crenobacter cavernae]
MTQWTRDEVLVALNLYTRLNFGQFHARQPLVIAAATALGRTPGSVAMKLCNLASLDPAIVDTGRVGLAKASKLDRDVWAAFLDDSESVGLESERITAALAPTLAEPVDQPSANLDPIVQDIPADYLISRTALVETRVGQRFFRRALLASYRGRCCMTGLAEPRLLVASHIKPWALDRQHRLNPSNGLLLSALHDKAFDTGLISLDDDLRVLVSDQIKSLAEHGFARDSLIRLEGRQIDLPEKWRPDAGLVRWHREEWFECAAVADPRRAAGLPDKSGRLP